MLFTLKQGELQKKLWFMSKIISIKNLRVLFVTILFQLVLIAF